MNPLQIFEKHPHMDAYRVGGFYSPYALVSADKRFSDAELAAEWHRAVSAFQSANDMADLVPCPETWSDQERDRGWMYAVERFATLPHYDETKDAA